MTKTKDQVYTPPGGEITMEHLFKAIMGIRDDLSTHMEKEEQSMGDMRKEIHELTSVIHAMPHVDGRPDFYGHRVDHDTLREVGGDIKKVRSRVRDKLVDYFVWALLVMVITGKGGEVLSKALEMLK